MCMKIALKVNFYMLEVLISGTQNFNTITIIRKVYDKMLNKLFICKLKTNIENHEVSKNKKF